MKNKVTTKDIKKMLYMLHYLKNGAEINLVHSYNINHHIEFLKNIGIAFVEDDTTLSLHQTIKNVLFVEEQIKSLKEIKKMKKKSLPELEEYCRENRFI
jgi:hypothetical protein